MTVAAVILAASVESALGDAAGLPRVRRLADVAWAGGAVPVIVVAPDPESTVASALTGAPITLAEPVPQERGPVGQIVRGIEVAAAEVRDTSAALIWPARLCWAGPETVTSLIEAHGTTPGNMLRPTYHGEAGWPVLWPLSALDLLRGLPPNRMPGDLLDDALAAGLSETLLELGDPGTVIDGETPLDQLPPYEGPPQPAAEHTHEWGAAIADRLEDAPLEGPSLAPFRQAEDEVAGG
jgi:CTP:molybdopterin cytidylyltransferase MocA